MQVVFRNYFYEATGFGNCARQLACRLEDAGVDVRIEVMGDRSVSLDKSELDRLRRLENKPNQRDQVLLTQEVQRRSQDRGRFAKALSCTMWETSKAPAEMVEGCNQFDGLILPNEFNRQTFLKGGAKVPLLIAPYGVDADLFHPVGRRERLGESEETFVFLSVFGWSHRKGPDILLKAYLQEFGEHEPVVLLIKTFAKPTEPIPRSWYEQAIQQVPRKTGTPRVRTFTDIMTPRKLAELYRGADCYVSPTRGEGVGLPFLESMACETPVIATGWSGHTDFIKPSNGYLIPFRLVPAQPLHYTQLYKPDQLWAEADGGSLQLIMRKAYADRDISRAKAKQARETAMRWNWERSAALFIQAIEKTVGTRITAPKTNEILKR
ncbi:glycosyltransferase family 4 protein [Cohnella sp. GCM10027633]|uniref:glycosyltransferase family 4 protein n=1 Tax=unclassified Cohnella TaxID=2636738 RepID=UPI0036352954